MDYHKQWIDQCEASKQIADKFGTEKAMGYLIGEKLINHLKEADKNALFEQEIKPFCKEIKNLFEEVEIRSYLESIKRTGAAGHVMADEEYEEVGHKMFELDAVESAKNILRVEQIKALLLD